MRRAEFRKYRRHPAAVAIFHVYQRQHPAEVEFNPPIAAAAMRR